MSTTPSSATTAPAQSIPSGPGRAAATGWLIGGIVAASIANALIALIALAAGASDAFQPLQPGAYVSFTVLGVLIGAAGWAVVRRRSADPRALLARLVPAVVIVSLVPDLAMFVSDYKPHADAAGIIALMLMHVAVAAVAVAAYHRALPLNDTPRG
ncbi:DUF6069 family protein [Streptomyces pristinaespiralis]|uniref:DUF6069 family protein n=1 Tax=Streptomyces pristinaespiralis TaxID=38300 RepID=UPI0038364F8F